MSFAELKEYTFYQLDFFERAIFFETEISVDVSLLAASLLKVILTVHLTL